MSSEGKRLDDKSGQKYLDADYLRYLESIYLSTRVRADGAYSGRHSSQLKGQAQEFTDYRKYYPGDSIRTIDWKVYARTDRLVIKLSELETVMTSYLLVDSSASMGFGGRWNEKYFGSEDISKFDYACYLAAAISYLTIKQGDKVGLTLFDSKIKYHTPAGSTYSHLYEILSRLGQNQVGKKTSLGHVLKECFPLFNRRGIIILISDMLDEPEELFSALDMYRHKNFEIVLFQIMHKYELDLPAIPSVNFIDSESGERITSIPDDVRGTYREHINGFIDSIASTAQARKYDYQLYSTETPYQEALRDYLAGRGR